MMTIGHAAESGRRLTSWWLRAAGLVLLGFAFLLFRYLAGRVDGGINGSLAPPASAAEMLLAAAVFVAMSIGNALLWLGGHLFDPVMLPTLPSDRFSIGHRALTVPVESEKLSRPESPRQSQTPISPTRW